MKNLINSDCIKAMKEMEENSVDTIITDPPYGLEFMGKGWDKGVPGIPFWKEMLRVAKPGATLLSFGGTRTYHRMACAIEDAGWQIVDCIFWCYGSGFPKSTNISKQLDKGHKRKVVKEYSAAKQKGSENWQGQDRKDGKGSGFGEVAQITEPSTPEAKLWNGWGTALKPAVEPIVVARKPNDGTFANNAIKWGVAGLNIDGGRIGTTGARNNGNSKGTIGSNSIGKYGKAIKQDYNMGRFPANLVLDEEAGKMLGEPSRFFYTAKASKSERNAGCEGLEEKQTVGGGGGIGDYKDDVNSCSGKYGSEKAPATNNHPTVKPLKLMEYLCTLTKTPTGGVVLDPFMGSGSTGVACVNTGRDFIGIEISPEYCKIAEERLKQKPLL